MRAYNTEDIRNVVLMGHGSVGKTTLGEAALFESGAITRMGSIADGNTVSDFDEDEHKRKFSLSLSVLPVEWEGRKINLIDTPGYADFICEVICGAEAADMALVVVDAVSGPEVGTDRALQVADRLGLPRMVVVNRMDRENADFDAVLATLTERFGSKIAPLQLPIGAHETFQGVIDLLHFKAYTPDEAPIPEDLVPRAEELRSKLIEAIVETDEELMEKYFADEELTEDELRRVLHGGLDQNLIIPVVVTSATKQIGVRQLLHNIAYSGPSPADRNPIEVGDTKITADPDGPVVVRVFKTSADPYVGKLTYLRVFSGTVKSDSHLWNANKGADERLGTLYVARGKEQIAVPELKAGDIGVVAKLAHTQTGDTLCTKEQQVQLPEITFPHPVYSMAVRPASKGAVDKLGPSLQRLVEEDPGLELSRDSAGEIVLAGLGDAHLEVTVDRLRRKFNIDVELATPRVPYRETIAKPSKGDYTHKKQTGGTGQFARVKFHVEPNEIGKGNEFVPQIVGGSIPREYIPGVEKGIRSVWDSGVLIGFPLVDMKVTLYDGAFHEVDSSAIAFEIAGRAALKEACDKGGIKLLEPVMNVEVVTPQDFVGGIIGDINSRRGQIRSQDLRGNAVVIKAYVPLANMFGYINTLRSMSTGRAQYSMVFAHYAEVPRNVADEVRAKYA